MDTNSHPFEIWQSWGVGSSRHTSCSVVMSEEHQFDVPIGPSIVRWNSSTQKRLLQFQAHPTLITCMRLSPDKRYFIPSFLYSLGQITAITVFQLIFNANFITLSEFIMILQRLLVDSEKRSFTLLEGMCGLYTCCS